MFLFNEFCVCISSFTWLVRFESSSSFLISSQCATFQWKNSSKIDSQDDLLWPTGSFKDTPLLCSLFCPFSSSYTPVEESAQLQLQPTQSASSSKSLKGEQPITRISDGGYEVDSGLWCLPSCLWHSFYSCVSPRQLDRLQTRLIAFDNPDDKKLL